MVSNPLHGILFVIWTGANDERSKNTSHCSPSLLFTTQKSGYNADLQHHICVFSLLHQHTIISTYYRFVFNLLSFAVCTIWTPQPNCLVIGSADRLALFYVFAIAMPTLRLLINNKWILILPCSHTVTFYESLYLYRRK